MVVGVNEKTGIYKFNSKTKNKNRWEEGMKNFNYVGLTWTSFCLHKGEGGIEKRKGSKFYG